MKRKNLSPGALTAPLPPCMVTVGDMENNNVLTVAWTGILATVPPKTYISVRPSRHSHKFLSVGAGFVINLPSAALCRAVDFVGIYTGAKMDKFERCSLTRVKSEVVFAPTIKECPIALECRVTEILNMGSHDVFFADILSISADEGIIDGEGKLHFEKADLLAYAHGEYYRLGERIGRFGFSTDKKKTAMPSGEKKTAEKKRDEPAEDISKKEPFYKNISKGKSKGKKSVSDKGKPHGKSRKGGTK